MRRASRVAAVLAALAGAAGASGGHAAAVEPAPVILLGPEDGVAGDAAALQRLAAELSLLGLRVRVETTPPPVTASARVRLDASHGKVEILFFDVATGATTLRQQLDAPPGPDTGALLVVRTVELVRAVLLPPPLPAPQPRATPLALAAAATPPPPPSPRAAIAVGGGALAMGGTVGAVATLSVAARARVAGPFGLELLTFAPLTRAATTTPEGHGQLATWVAGGGVFAAASRGRFAFDAALGALALWLRTEGTPTPGYVETQASAVGAAAHGRVGAAWVLGPQLAARFDVLAGALVRRPVVVFPDSDTRAAWARVFAGASLSLEARF